MKIDTKMSCVALVAAAMLVCAARSSAYAQQTTPPPSESVQAPAQAVPPDKAADKKKDDQVDDQKPPEKPRQVDRVRIRMDGHEEPVTGGWAAASGDGFHPLVGYIVSGSGISAGLNYQRLQLGGSPIGFNIAGEVSYLGFQLYRLQVGHLANRDTTESLASVDADVAMLFNDFTVKRRGMAAYADMRYINYPAAVFVGAGSNAPGTKQLNYVWFGALLDGVVQYQFTPTFGVSGRVGLLAPGLWNRSEEAGEVGAQPAIAPVLLGVPHFATAGGAAVLDARDKPSDPHRGAFLGTAVWRFNELGGGTYDFLRMTVDGRWYHTLFSPRGVLAARALASVEQPDHGAVVPFYLQQTLGGNATLRGFAPYRFRGRALGAFSAEYRFLVNRYVDVGPFVDGGSVVRSFVRLEFGKPEWSGGIRAGVRLRNSVMVNLGWGHCREGDRFFIGAGTLF
jgi:hypothetical protein